MYYTIVFHLTSSKVMLFAYYWLSFTVFFQPEKLYSSEGNMHFGGTKLHLHLHLSHLADALIQSDLQIGAFTLWHPVEQSLYNSASKS
jgi:hypothetical protein